MRKNIFRLLSLVLVLSLTLAVFTACGQQEAQPTETTEAATGHVDYVEQTKLDMNSETKKEKVTWGERSHIDGDTSHFEVSRSVDSSGVIKARYLAVDTPESTGQIEEWGRAASRFTKEKLSTAVSIIVESDTASWNYDGNGRYLVWVWYQPAEGADYRCLNIELLQEGLGASSKASDGRYGTTAVAAIAQATTEKLYMFSQTKDPEFPYGEAASITLRELRTNVEKYEGLKVAVEGVITFNSDYTAYIESYDAETDMTYGMQVFYGYISQLIPVLEQGALVRIVGVVNNFYGTYQITSLKYNPLRVDDPANTSRISTGNEVAFTEVSPEVYTGDVTVTVDEEEKTVSYQELAVSTSISMKELMVQDVYTTTNPQSDDCGAMTLTCFADGETIKIRTEVLKDDDGNLITEEAYAGKTISVKGILDHYEGTYQIRVFSAKDITVLD